MVHETNIMDKLTNFRIPATRDGVIFLFGKVGEELSIYVEEIKVAFPICLARRYTGSGWEKVKIEFEYRSADFKKKGHDPAGCDIIVCWENNWPDCPLEVIELEDRLSSLPDETVTPPDADFESFLDTLFDSLKVNDNIRKLMKSIDRQIKDIDERIWAKATDECIVYYSPEKPFLYAYPKPKLVNFQLYSGDESIEGVRYYRNENASSTWGYINLDYGSIQTTLNAIKESFRLAKEAVKGNGRMGFFNAPPSPPIIL
jgi:hypothetical protein